MLLTASSVVAGITLGGPATKASADNANRTSWNASSTKQYLLTNSDGTTWQQMDGSTLVLSVTPAVTSDAVLTANTSMFTNNSGVNTDLAVEVNQSLVAWKEAGGYSAAHPAAVFVQTEMQMYAGTTYIVALYWKTNVSQPSNDYSAAGAGSGSHSPTVLSALLTPHNAALVSARQSANTFQPSTTSTSWTPMDTGGSLTTTITTPGTTSDTYNALITANADTFAASGANQDVGICYAQTGSYGVNCMSTPAQAKADQENAGSSAYMPIAALVQYNVALTGGTSWSTGIVWKVNGSGWIYGAAGAGSGSFSPDSIIIQLTKSTDNELSGTSQTNQETRSYSGSDPGTAWETVPGVAPLTVASGTNWLTYLGGNASLFSSSGVFNIDLGICVVNQNQSCDSAGTYIAGWSEGAGGAAWSPDATFLQVPFYMYAANSYTAYLQWRTNVSMANGDTIYAGLGSSPNVTSFNALQIPSAPPSAPTGVGASAGNGQATVSWTASASSPGSPQTGYAVTPYLGSTKLETFNLGNVSSFTVPNLANGPSYTFAVSGVNGYGAGPAGTSNAVVPGLSGAPTGLTAGTAGNGTVALSWTAPAASGASAVTGYVITPYIGGTAQSATTFWGTNTSATVNGLSNGSAYTFEVAALNAFGTGPQSSASAAKTPGAQAPGTATSVAAAAGNHQATVSWVAPAANGSGITSYTITPYIGGSAQSTSTCTAPCSSKVVTGLSNGTTYTFTVKAVNAIGTGSESTHSWNATPASTTIVPSLSLAVAGGTGGLWPIGGTATFTATISANAGATTGSFADTLPAYLSGQGSQIQVNGAACPTGTTCTAAAGSITVTGLAIPATGNVVVTYSATPTGPLNACATLTDSASVSLSGGNSAGYVTRPIAACDSGIGSTSWFSSSGQSLGQKSAAAVNPSSGNLAVQATDGIPMQLHRDLTFTLTRIYNSQDTGLSGIPFPVGNGWILSFVQAGTEPAGIALVQPTSTSFGRVAPVTMVDGTGARYTYTPSALGTAIDVGSLSSTGTRATLIPLNLPLGTGYNDRCVDTSFLPPAGLHVAMSRYIETSNSNCSNLGSATGNAVLGYVSIGIDRVRREYNATGQLLNVEDAAGNAVNYAYSSGKLSAVTETGSNRAYSISYGSPVKITEPSGEVIDYAQSSSTLTSVYADNGGADTAKFVYAYGGCSGASAGQLCQVQDANNNSTTFAYSAAGAGPARVATITDRKGNTTTFTYNATNVTADRGSERTNYAAIDQSGRVAELDQGTTANTWVHQTFYFWDANASGVSCRQPEAASDNDLCAIIRRGLTPGAADRVTYYTYSDEGQMLSQRELDNAADLWTTAGYSDEYFEAGGNVATYSDSVAGSGNVNSTSQTGGRRDASTIFEVLTQTQSLTPRGNAAGSGYSSYLTTYKVDSNSAVSTNTTGGSGLCGTPATPTANTGLMCEIDAPAYDGTHATQTNYQYNNDGSRSRMYSPKDNVQGLNFTAYTYYQNSDKDLSGTVSAGGWLKGISDDTTDCMLPLAGPCFVAHAYDAAGQVVRTWDRNAVNASGTPLSSTAWNSESSPPSTAYSETLYPSGQFMFESTAIATPGLYPQAAGTATGEWSTSTYDGNGNLIGSKTARGNLVGNPLQRLQFPSCPAPTTENVYDTCRLYDKNDNLTSVLTPMEANTSNPETGGTQRFTTSGYDQYDNRVSTINGNGSVTVAQFDSANRQTAKLFTLAAWNAGMNAPPGCRQSTSGDAPIPAGRILCTNSTAYDGVDNTISSIDGNGNINFTLYDAAHRKSVAITPRNDGTYADLVAVTLYDADGHVTDICPPREIAEGTGDNFACTANATYGSHTTYDSMGRAASTYAYQVAGTPLTTRTTYDPDGNKLTVNDANGHQTVNTYLPNDWLSSSTVPRDSTHAYTTYDGYDPSGDLILKSAPVDGTNTRNFEYTYDADHRVVDTITGASTAPPDTSLYSQSAGTDVRTRNVYDANGNVVEQYTQDAFSGSGTLGNPDPDFATGAAYNQDDQQSEVYRPRYDTNSLHAPQLTDPTGNATQSSECPGGGVSGFNYPSTLGICTTGFAYDPAGNIARVSWPTSNGSAFTAYTYTDNNLVFSQQGPSPATGAQITTNAYMYDADGKQTYSVDANNVAQWTIYNADESVAATETSNSTGYGLRVTNNSHDANGEQAKTIDAVGDLSSTTYLPNGWKKSTSDGAGDVTSYTYDSIGNPISVLSPSGNASDATNPNGVPTYNTYSEDNLLVSSASPVGAKTSNVLQRAVCYYYDQSGRKTAQGNWVNTGGVYYTANPCPTSPGSNSFTFNNLADDRLSAESGRNGNAQLQFSYDAAGNRVWTADQTSNVTTTSSFYADNMPRTANDGVGRYTNYAYDGAGSVTERSSVPGSGTTYTDTITYSPADQEAAETSSVTSGTTSWSYDAGGRPTTMTYGNADALQYGYNVHDGTLSTETLWNGTPGGSSTAESTFTQTLDGDYRVSSDGCTCLNGSGANVGHSFNYAYDQAGHLTFIGASNGAYAYQSYDHDGNRLVHTDPTTGAVTTYTYNSDDSLATTSKNNVTTTSVYDSYGGGTLVSDGCTNDSLDTFDRTSQYSAVSNPPSSCTSPAPPSTTYTYNANGAEVTQAASGFTTTINSDSLTGKPTVEDAGNGVVSTETAYETSAAGNPISLTQGSTQEVLTDDPKGDLATSMTTNNQVQCQLQFDPYGVATFTGTSSNLCETGSTVDDLFYQNSRRDSSSGQYQLGSRYYDPTKNSFLQPDHFQTGSPAQDLSVGTDPLTRNAYGFVNGDPVNLVDPSGHDPCGDCNGQVCQAGDECGGGGGNAADVSPIFGGGAASNNGAPNSSGPSAGTGPSEDAKAPYAPPPQTATEAGFWCVSYPRAEYGSDTPWPCGSIQIDSPSTEQFCAGAQYHPRPSTCVFLGSVYGSGPDWERKYADILQTEYAAAAAHRHDTGGCFENQPNDQAGCWAQIFGLGLMAIPLLKGPGDEAAPADTLRIVQSALSKASNMSLEQLLGYLTPGQRAQLLTNPQTTAMFGGTAVHNATAQILDSLPGMENRFTYNASRGPDITDTWTGNQVEISTEAQAGWKALKYPGADIAIYSWSPY